MSVVFLSRRSGQSHKPLDISGSPMRMTPKDFPESLHSISPGNECTRHSHRLRRSSRNITGQISLVDQFLLALSTPTMHHLFGRLQTNLLNLSPLRAHSRPLVRMNIIPSLNTGSGLHCRLYSPAANGFSLSRVSHSAAGL